MIPMNRLRFLTRIRANVQFCLVFAPARAWKLGFVGFCKVFGCYATCILACGFQLFFNFFTATRARICGFMRFLHQIAACEYATLQSGNFLFFILGIFYLQRCAVDVKLLGAKTAESRGYYPIEDCRLSVHK